MIKKIIGLLIGLFLSVSSFSGGNSKDLGPVEVLDIIVEQEKAPIKGAGISKEPKAKTDKAAELDISGAVVDVKDDKGDVQKIPAEVITVETPVVEQKISAQPEPVKRIDTAAKVESEDFADKPIGHPTGKVEDIAPKIYKTCEDMFKSDNFLIKTSCAVILGTFIVL